MRSFAHICGEPHNLQICTIFRTCVRMVHIFLFFRLIFHLSYFFLTSANALLFNTLITISPSYFLLSYFSGQSSLKMKHRLPSSGTSTIFMLSQTASSHSFSWSDWGLFFFVSFYTSEFLSVHHLPASYFCVLPLPLFRLLSSPIITQAAVL